METTNHHTPIPSGSPVNASVYNLRYRQLDGAITQILNGGLTLTGLNLGEPDTLQITGGAITKTAPFHLIDTESGAAEDDLTTLNGGNDGDVLILAAANGARVPTIRHGIGNIDTSSELDERLDNIRKYIIFVKNNDRWGQLGGVRTKALNYNGLRVPYGMPVSTPLWARNRWRLRASAAGVVADGMAAPTGATGMGTVTVANDTDSTYVNLPTGNIAGNASGYVSTYNLVRRQHNPLFSAVLRTGAATDIAAIRLWIGLCSAAITNVDTIAGTTEFAGFRFSPAAGDTSFVPVTKDASTQAVGAGIAAVTALTRYLLQLEVDSANNRILFSVNNGTPTILTSNLPQTTTELGFNAVMFTTGANIRNWKLSRLECEYD